MAELQEEQIKLVQINVWLAKQQKVEIYARKTVSGHLCKLDPDFRRTGVASRPGTIDVVCQLAEKLCNALREKDPSITILVDRGRIEPDSDE